MASNRRELVIAITSDATQVSRGFDKAGREVSSFGRQADAASKGGVRRLDSRVGALRASMSGVVGIAAAGVAFRGIAEATRQAEKLTSAYAITEQVIKQTGGAANVTTEEIKSLSREQAFLTGINKEVILTGNNVLLTFKNVRNELGEGNDVFNRASALMLDIATVMGTDAKSAALQLGKALNDPVSQMGALSRAGLTFTAEQSKMIKEMVRGGDLLGAQTIILDELESQLGGTAEAAADASAKIARAFDEIEEAAGTAFLPFLEHAATEIAFLTGQIDELGRLEAITGQDSSSVGFLGGQINEIALNMQNMERRTGDASSALRSFEQGVLDLINAADAPRAALNKLRDGVDILVESFGLSREQGDILRAVLNDILSDTGNLDGNIRGVASTVELFGESFATTGEEVSTVKFHNKNVGVLAQQLQAAEEAARNTRLAILELANPAFAAVKAREREQQAEENLQKVKKDAESTAQDVARAELALAEARIESFGALEKFDGAGVAGQVKLIADAMNVSYEEAKKVLEIAGILDSQSIDIPIVFNISTVGSPPPLGEIVNGRPGSGVSSGSGGGSSTTNNTNINVYNPVPQSASRDIQRELLLSGIGNFVE